MRWSTAEYSPLSCLFSTFLVFSPLPDPDPQVVKAFPFVDGGSESDPTSQRTFRTVRLGKPTRLVGLGVSDFVYRIFGFSEICSFRISHNRMAMRPHGKKQCPKKSVYILLFALQLLFSRFISFRVSFRSITFFRPPTPACIYISIYSRSISNRYGSLLSAVAIGLNIPSGVTVRPTHDDEDRPNTLQLPPWALHGSNVANEALNHHPSSTSCSFTTENFLT